MTQTAQIQALLNQIDAALSKPNPRLPWMVSGAAAQQRRVLERTRSYLMMLQQQLAGANLDQPGRNVSPVTPYPQAPAESAQQVLQAVMQEMGYLRSNVMQPLRTDVEMLRQQRDGLQQEIRQLEAQRQQYGLPQSPAQQQMINDFLQALMARLQDNLTGQVTQMVGTLETQAAQGRALDASPNAALSSTQRLEQLQAIQAESDQLLLKLDSTLRVVFESLQNNVQSYHDSLSGGLGKMHALGQQGEAMFAALINRLAQQLGREASSYLQSSGSRDPLSPQPGAAEEISDAQIDRFLSELGAAPALPEKTLIPTTTLTNQDLLGIDLTLSNLRAGEPQAELAQPEPDEEITLFQVDESVLATIDRPDPLPDPLFETDEEPTQIQPPSAAAAIEVDEFYESLFGEAKSAPSEATPLPLDNSSAATPVDGAINTDGGTDGIDAEAALFDDALFERAAASTSPAPENQSTLPPLSSIPEEKPQSDLSTQSLENFLFGTEPIPSSDTSGSQPPAQPAASSPSQEVEAIVSLSDLVIDDAPIAPANQLPQPVSPSAAVGIAAPQVPRSTGEESYIPAAPDENLLATEEPQERVGLELNLDPDVLQQLSTDLSNLEGREDDYPPIVSLSAIDDDDRTLSLEDNPPPPQPSSQAEPIPPAIDDVTTFDDLFTASEPPGLEQPQTGTSSEPSLPLSETNPLLAASLDDLFPQSESIATIEPDAPIDLAPPASTPSQPLASPEPGVSPDDLPGDLFATLPTEDVAAANAAPAITPSAFSELTLADFNISPTSPEPIDRASVAEPYQPDSEDLFAALNEISTPADGVPVEPIAAAEGGSLDDLFAAVEPPQEPQPAALPDLLAISPALPEPAANPPAATDPVTIEDLFSDSLDLPAPADAAPEISLTIEDFAQDVLLQPPTEDLFAAAELEDLFTEAETLSAESSAANDLATAAPTPSLQEQSILGELFFSDAANLPTEALAPEEEGLTLGNFADYVTPAQDSQPPTAANAVPPDLQPDVLEDLFISNVSPQPQPDSELEAFTLEGFAEEEVSSLTDIDALEELFAIPQPAAADEELTFDDFTLESAELPLDSLPQSAPDELSSGDRPSEETAFTLEGLDLLFEDLTDTPAANPVEAADTADSGSLESESLEDIFADLDQTAPEETRFLQGQTETNQGFEDPQKKKTVADELADWLGIPEALETIAPSSPIEIEIDAVTLPIEPTPTGILIPDEEFLTLETPAEVIPPPHLEQSEANAKTWYLGIDIGTTGISAVLLNRLTCELHPIYWSDEEKSFRLPTAVHLSPGGTVENAVTIARSENGQPEAAQAEPLRLLLRDFKPYLKVGIPHYSPQSAGWEPVLQWSDQQTVPLSVLHQALQSLLATLSAQRASAIGQLTCGAVGLEAEEFQSALRQLAQAIVGYPVNWSDTYSLNVREAVLSARLVAHPEQVCFIEDVIASLLSGLRSADGRSVVLPNGLSQKSQLHNADWQGGTLAISAGATTTELAFVNLPSHLDHLTYRDFVTRSLPYGGNAIDQDIICQLFRQPRRPDRRGNLLSGYSFGGSQTAKSGAARETWLDPNLEQSIWDAWDTIGWADLTLPSPGEPDVMNRQRLQQRLESSPLGQQLLEAAAHLKLILQQPDQQGDQQRHLTRQELGSRVILPYIQRLNRELNTLLAQTGTATEAINQVICTGGTASLRSIARWLRQKLPNATIIQDTYSRPRALSPQDVRSMTCSRVAYGLAMLPLHPQVLDVARQQYSDYFLLLELLRALPDQPLSAGSVMQLLERRGINTQACHLHILALLEGHLPPGLVPIEKDAYLLTPKSRQNPDYAALLEAPLFHKRDNQTYEPNEQQRHRYLQYLNTLLASTHQTLSEPLTANFV